MVKVAMPFDYLIYIGEQSTNNTPSKAQKAIYVTRRHACIRLPFVKCSGTYEKAAYMRVSRTARKGLVVQVLRATHHDRDPITAEEVASNICVERESRGPGHPEKLFFQNFGLGENPPTAACCCAGFHFFYSRPSTPTDYASFSTRIGFSESGRRASHLNGQQQQNSRVCARIKPRRAANNYPAVRNCLESCQIDGIITRGRNRRQ